MMHTRALSRLAGRGLTKLNGSKQLTNIIIRPCLLSEPFPFLLPRGFTTSPQSQKKKQKGGGGGGNKDYSDIPGMTPPDPSLDSLQNKPGIFNHTKLSKNIANVTTRFKDEINRARSFVGKMDPKIFEELNVEIKLANPVHEKTSHKLLQKFEKHKLRELAHVAQKTAKEVTITVHEPRYVDLVAATVMEQLNMNAQRVASANNVLRIEIPPPTVESRKQKAKEVQDMFTAAKTQLDSLKRDSHNELRKQHKNFKKDEINKAEKEMQGLLSNAEDEMKKLCESTKKMIES